ncbi:phosphoribosylamine--glycine ligase [Tepidibacillus decaturensis]|uniref:Phosphoribosylamine--glycine ligase n=1 Tax=Tepidibacillus decaturensis TaxID=1413211 RepID=A0A135L0U3_9BACI|nr:phosphoribosylamine--glycine ligase [Tepidibacillus decaturensis]KXG42616.1 phosphoribosylamine--glycine ligase [Tepidibacillus decaturensis]
MNILVVGQGGREHAIVKSLKKSPKVNQVYCAPGNGGIAQDAICLPIAENDFEKLITAVREYKIDLTVVGPEQPLIEGIVDVFQEQGLPIIGPTKAAAQIEGSKSFAKQLMGKYRIPTGNYQVFYTSKEAIDYVKQQGVPVVIKADGIAAGKGVVVAHQLEEAISAINSIMEDKIFGDAGQSVVIEEFLSGEELTVMAFVDANSIAVMEPAQDHKPVYDGDKGPNTGGMGAYSPVPHMKESLLNEVYDQILLPTVEAMKQEGIPFTGILYAGLMITNEGPMVIEFNARFGDPETQVVLPRLETDLVEVLLAIRDKRLNEMHLEWKKEAAVSVVMVSAGYPKEYKKGMPIIEHAMPSKTQVFYAGAKLLEEQLVTAGGRVLAVTGLGTTIEEAQRRAYQGVNNINFEGAHYRRDIANKAINRIAN